MPNSKHYYLFPVPKQFSVLNAETWLYLHDLLLFSSGDVIDVLAIFIGEILNVFFVVLQVVLGDLGGFLHCLIFFHCITADGADGYLGFLRGLLNLFAELFSALFCEGRENED